MEEMFPIAQNEAKSAFGDESLYMEKLIQPARHIEVQVIADKKGNVVALGERECSIQRKHQKLVEESPSSFIDEKMRRRLIKAAEDAARHIGYQSLGTFEFLVDQHKKYYFMEANARIQVEHPVTEMIYNVDLIKAQIKVAAGEKVPFSHDLKYSGHSIECRINAEDAKTFIPSPGKIDFLVLPGGEGIRVDSAAYCGWQIPPDYDSLIAKIVVKAPTRGEAVKKMLMALEMTTFVGIKTNLPLLINIVSHSDFIKGNYDIQFMDRFLGKKQNRKKS
jgi:acetyl-CoA carboxylase biotin carboxylase subunit